MTEVVRNRSILETASVQRATPSLLIASMACIGVLLVCVLARSDFQHWFIFPIACCGALCAGKVWSDWQRGVDVFDPLSINAILGIHLFFVAPLLHVATRYWMPYIEAPGDWRPWLGFMAVINLLGIALYGWATTSLSSSLEHSEPSTVWRLNTKRFYFAFSIAIALCTVLQLGVYAKFGGIGGYVEAFSEGAEEFTGMGLTFLFSESAPILAAMIVIVWAKARGRCSTLTIVCILAGFIVLKVLFGGLRGSRGHLIYGLFWAAMLVHVLLRPLPKQLFVWAVAAMLPFMYAYGFYKSFGVSAIDAIDSSARADLLDAAPRGFEAMLLGDLARSDVQAFILYRLSGHADTTHYQYAWGETYLGTASLVVPRAILSQRPKSKVQYGTELLFGPHVYENEMASTFAYGITGEAMLNFGPVGGVVSFAFVGAIAAFAKGLRYSLPASDCRWLLLPHLLSLAFLTLLWDTDVLLFYTVKEGAFPAFLLFVCSQRTSSASGSETSS